MNQTCTERTSRIAGLRAELRDLYDDYALCLDENRLEDWPEFFTEDCHYRVLSRENHDAGLPLGLIYCMNKNMLRDRVTAIRETTMFEPRSLRHFISGVTVREDQGQTLVAQANFAIMESLSDREPCVSMVGRYLDRWRATDAGWRLTYRDCVYDNYRVLTSLIVPV